MSSARAYSVDGVQDFLPGEVLVSDQGEGVTALDDLSGSFQERGRWPVLDLEEAFDPVPTDRAEVRAAESPGQVFGGRG
ncbi:hypothetical protein [Streptomyces mirabilis]|uniref:hypothetical protein n=1 Tax=Streptomyces mirabilis TaxID=68239 RepID=UPI00369D230C